MMSRAVVVILGLLSIDGSGNEGQPDTQRRLRQPPTTH
jgi:hypothetical protein